MASRRTTRRRKEMGGSRRKGMMGYSRKTRKQGGGGSAWLTAVKKAYAKLKKTKKDASLGDAMKEAKKTYKK